MNNQTDIPDYTKEELAKLTPIELTDILIEHEDRSPRSLIEECAQRGEDMVSHLHALHNCSYLWQHDASSGVWWLRLHATMILGWIPSKSAGLLLVELMRRMSQEDDNNLQDWLAGYWPALFRNKPENVMPALRLLAEDKSMDWYMRVNTMETLLESASRQSSEALEQALAWLAKIAEDENEDWKYRLSAANYLLDFPRAQYRPLLEKLEARQTGLGKHYDRHSIEQAYTGKNDSPQWQRFGNPWKFYDPEIIAHRQQRWQKEDAREEEPWDSHDGEYDWGYQEPYVRPEPKVGRNDPCPCGSGKKYKQCCLKTGQTQPENEFLWRRIRHAIEGSPIRMLEFASSYFSKEALQEAWDDFMPHWENEEDEPFTMDTPHMPVFMPWFFYEWLPDPHDTAVKREALDEHTVGQAYLARKGCQLDPLLAHYIEQCCANPFSFYDILSVRPGKGFAARDIFTGDELEVTEQSGSRQSRAGDILFGKLVTIDGVTMLEACASFMFPPMEKGAVLDLRKQIERCNKTITPEVLREYRYEMLGIYHDIVDRLLNPPMPQLQNTDGDPMVFNKLIYDLRCTPQEAFDALRQLNLTEDDESILSGAKFDPSGKLREIEFAWQKAGNEKHEDWNNTILGHLRIAGATLSAEVNSENRAQQFKKLMEKLLPGKARYTTTVIQSPQAMLNRMKEESKTTAKEKELDELNCRS